MSTKRNRYSAVFKAKVAVEAIRGLKTTAALASEHQVHPTLINQWKRQALENLASLFEVGNTRPEPDIEAVTAPLYEQIGRLKVEFDWLRKKTERLG
jgi:transposase-like protein